VINLNFDHLSFNMEIKHRAGSNGSFYIEKQGEQLGEMVYRMSGNVMIIEHTEVSDELKGKGAGKQLVAAAVDYARKNNLKIKPLCSFTRAVINRVKEYQDVLDR
jgi:predicted GNAT family acetyltransferase